VTGCHVGSPGSDSGIQPLAPTGTSVTRTLTHRWNIRRQVRELISIHPQDESALGQAIRRMLHGARVTKVLAGEYP